MVEENDFKDIFSDFNESDENTSDIFDAIMNSDIPDEDASVENGGEDSSIEDGGKEEASVNGRFQTEDDTSFFSNDILTNSGSAGLDDDPFGDSLFAEAPQATAGIDSDNPFADLEVKETATSNDDGNPFADMEKADKSIDSLASNDNSFFGDTSSPFASTQQDDNQEDTFIDDFLKSIP